MTVGERRLKSAVVASLELSLRKVRGLLGGTISDMIVFLLVLDHCRRCRDLRLIDVDVLERRATGRRRKKGGREDWCL